MCLSFIERQNQLCVWCFETGDTNEKLKSFCKCNLVIATLLWGNTSNYTYFPCLRLSHFVNSAAGSSWPFSFQNLFPFFFIFIRHTDLVCIFAISYSKHVPMLFLSSKHPREWLFKSCCTLNYLLIRRSSSTKVPLYKVPAVHIILCEKGDLLYGKSLHYKIWFDFTSFFYYVSVM